MEETNPTDQTDGTDDDPNAEILDEESLAQLDGTIEHPVYNLKDNIFKFFTKIIRLKDSTKVANLGDLEVGKMRLSMRSYKELANYASTEGLDLVSHYLNSKAEIMASTSMGRKGFLLQTAVTQIRKDQKISSNPQPQKTNFWNRNQPQQQNNNIGEQ